MGGGAMRTAAKAATLGGYRSVGASSSRAAAPQTGGRTTRTPNATVWPAGLGVEVVRPVTIVSSDKGLQDVVPLSAIQRPLWDFDFDDWELAESGDVEEAAVALDSQYQAPRLVFGHAPTLAEAWEATSDLKDALNTVYPSRVGSAEEAADESTHRVSSSIISSVPGYVSKTFSLLQADPEVQNVVASIAADKNVWDAIMNNEKVVEFYSTHHASILPPESDSTSEVVPSDEADDDSTNAEAAETLTFSDFVHNVKAKVMDVVSGLSDLIQDFFNTLSSSDESSDEAGKWPFAGRSLGEALMALAVATILVVLVKRG